MTATASDCHCKSMGEDENISPLQRTTNAHILSKSTIGDLNVQGNEVGTLRTQHSLWSSVGFTIKTTQSHI